MERVGEIDGREILVDVRDDGAVWLLFEWEQWWDRTARLGEMLGVQEVCGPGQEWGKHHLMLAYDDRLDRVLVELIDLLVGIRLAHPRMVQLELAMPEGEGERLQLALEGVGSG